MISSADQKSAWTESVDLKTSRSYLRDLLVHLDSPPSRSIHVNHIWHSFSSNSITNFCTVYFPIRKCSISFKKQISSHVDTFIDATKHPYTSPFESLRSVGSGWIKETKMVGGEVTNGFMLCLLWTDEESEERFKSSNEHWKALMQYLKGVGMLQEEQFHGKAYRAFGDYGQGRSDVREAQIVGQGDYWKSKESMPAMTGPELGVYGNQPGAIDSAKTLYQDPAKESFATVRGVDKREEADISDTDSHPCTPILTPSSSTLSLNSLFDEAKPLSGMPCTWQSEYDSSRHQQELTKDFPACEPRKGSQVNTNLAPTWYPVCQLRRDDSGWSDDEDDEAGNANANPTPSQKLAPHSTSNSQHSSFFSMPEALSPKNAERITKSEFKSNVSGPLCQFVVPKWDADAELRNVKARFWRRRNRFVETAPRLEIQRAEL